MEFGYEAEDKVWVSTDKEMDGLESLKFSSILWVSWDRVMTETRRVKSTLRQTEGKIKREEDKKGERGEGYWG